MRLSLVSAVAVAVVSIGIPARAQHGRQLELSVLGGTAHTDRSARLSAEEASEPYSGVRVDARVAQLWGGRVGVALQLDRYRARLDGMTTAPCMSPAGTYCETVSVLLSSALVPVAIRSFDERALVGATWQRPLASWLTADLLGLFGVRRVESVTKLSGVPFGESFPSVKKGVFAAQAGVSAQWRGVVGGAAFEYGGGGQWNGVRRRQNRLALRAGYAIPLGGSH